MRGEARVIHEPSRGFHGTPRVHAELVAQGRAVGRKRLERSTGVSRRRSTRPEPSRWAPRDLIERPFRAETPNRLWMAEITYVPIWAEFVFLAVVLDVFSRHVMGRAMVGHLRTELVLEVFDITVRRRRCRPEAVIHHSLGGAHYPSLALGNRCREMGVRPSTLSAGDCYDNAVAEIFFATVESELIARRSFRTRAEAKMALFEFIEGWYNPHRRHSATIAQDGVPNHLRGSPSETENNLPFPVFGYHSHTGESHHLSTRPGQIQ